MEKVLLLRSYLVGHALSIADIAVYAALRSKPFTLRSCYGNCH